MPTIGGRNNNACRSAKPSRRALSRDRDYRTRDPARGAERARYGELPESDSTDAKYNGPNAFCGAKEARTLDLTVRDYGLNDDPR